MEVKELFMVIAFHYMTVRIKFEYFYLQGIDGIMADARSLLIMIEGIGINSVGWKESVRRSVSLKHFFSFS